MNVIPATRYTSLPPFSSVLLPVPLSIRRTPYSSASPPRTCFVDSSSFCGASRRRVTHFRDPPPPRRRTMDRDGEKKKETEREREKRISLARPHGYTRVGQRRSERRNYGNKGTRQQRQWPTEEYSDINIRPWKKKSDRNSFEFKAYIQGLENSSCNAARK